MLDNKKQLIDFIMQLLNRNRCLPTIPLLLSKYILNDTSPSGSGSAATELFPSSGVCRAGKHLHLPLARNWDSFQCSIWVPGEVLREPPDILAVQPESRTSRRRKSCLKSLHLYRPSMGTVTAHLFAFALSLHKSHEFSLLFHSVFCTLHTSPLMLTAAAPCPYQPLHDQLSCSFLSKCLLM